MKINNCRTGLHISRPFIIGAVTLSMTALTACGSGDSTETVKQSEEAGAEEAPADTVTGSSTDAGSVDIVIDKDGEAYIVSSEASGGDAGDENGESGAGTGADSEADAAEGGSAVDGQAAETIIDAEYDDSIKDDYYSNTLDSLKGIPAGTVLTNDQIDWEHIDKYFTTFDIEEGDAIYERINGKSYRANDYVPLSSLIYLKLPHYNFNGEVQVGEIIVCRDIVDDVKNVFKELFESQYQIESMHLVDNYWTGDPDTTDSASIDVNNTSSFCYRNATGGGNLSQHAYGRAIDINPQQNPYVSYSSGSPKWSHSNADAYIDRSTGLAHVITHDDLAFKIFTQYGFTWGGDWTSPKDYQHFQKKK